MPENPWDDLAVIHLDSDGGRRAGDAAPTPLAPWRTWLCRGYRPCADADAFARELAAELPAAIVLLHRNDMDAALRCADLSAWLAAGDAARPTRQLVLYHGNWPGWGDCTADNVLPAVGARLPADAWGRTWSALPRWHLTGEARPVGWLGRRTRPGSISPRSPARSPAGGTRPWSTPSAGPWSRTWKPSSAASSSAWCATRCLGTR